MTVAHLAAKDEQHRVASLTLAVNALDMGQAGAGAAFLDDLSGNSAMADSKRRGYLPGASLAETFAWMRPNDMVWGYWVNNYLLGQKPPPFDILFWNGDQTNMPAALHRDFVEQGLENSLIDPGALEVLGTPLDLGKITVDTYVIAGIGDHLIPWQSAYRTTQLLGSEHARFVLSTSGHIAAMVNPPGNEKANFKAAEENPKRPKQWLEASETVEGSWWPDWTDWLGERSGDERPAPDALGSKRHPAQEDAPGTYVLAAAV
jgi:poly(3-hydroxyalkanoate) synthetase